MTPLLHAPIQGFGNAKGNEQDAEGGEAAWHGARGGCFVMEE